MVLYCYLITALFIFVLGYDKDKEAMWITFLSYLMLLPMIGRCCGWW